jgi:hypothetical protein
MPYLTYRADTRGAWRRFRGPARTWFKAAFTVHDPFKLFPPTMKFVAHAMLFVSKLLFFSGRKVLNH